MAPKHAALFVKTAKAGGYDGTTFHRVIMGGIIQGGDPLTKDPAKASLYGTGGLGLLKAEFSDRPFVRGTVAAARKPSSPDSGGRQFFVVMREQPSLKGQYTIFGEVVSGMEVVDQISTTPVDGDKAKERVEMKVTVQEPRRRRREREVPRRDPVSRPRQRPAVRGAAAAAAPEWESWDDERLLDVQDVRPRAAHHGTASSSRSCGR